VDKLRNSGDNVLLLWISFPMNWGPAVDNSTLPPIPPPACGYPPPLSTSYPPWNSRMTRGSPCVFPTIHIPTGAASFLYHAYVWIRTDSAHQEKRMPEEHVCPFLKSLSCAMVLVAGVSVPDLSRILLRNALCNHPSGCIPPVNQNQNRNQHPPLAPVPPAGGCSCSSPLCSSWSRPIPPGKENDLLRHRRRSRRRSSARTSHGLRSSPRPGRFPRCRQPHPQPHPLPLAARPPLPHRKGQPLRRAATNWPEQG